MNEEKQAERPIYFSRSTLEQILIITGQYKEIKKEEEREKE